MVEKSPSEKTSENYRINNYVKLKRLFYETVYS